MKIIRGQQYKGEQAWDALLIANMNGVTCRLHWTDKPYQWHINDGKEVFVVLDGTVIMHYKRAGKGVKDTLEVGDIFYACVGTEHYAEPIGEARVLVVEKQGSI
ncbi:MAG: cupin [Oceanospirillaceae bacterium]|nr:cupin [Colwellia sp.]NQZ30185.1 cupin [Oceanospirillaceae bacterium]